MKKCIYYFCIIGLFVLTASLIFLFLGDFNRKKEIEVNQRRDVNYFELSKHSGKSAKLLLSELGNALKANKCSNTDDVNQYVHGLSSFGPEELAKIYSEFKEVENSDFILYRIREVVSSYGEISDLTAFLTEFNSNDSKHLLQSIAKNSLLFQIQNVKESLSHLKDKNIDISFMSTAIRNIIEKSPSEQRIDLLNDYLNEVSEHEIVSGKLASYWMETYGVEDLSNARQFLLEEDPAFAKFADKSWIEIQARTDPNLAIEFINELSEREEIERASEAARHFAMNYSISNPQQAFEWALSLPQEFGRNRNSAISSAYRQLLLQSPDIAEKIENSTDDKILLLIFEGIKSHVNSIGLEDVKN